MTPENAQGQMQTEEQFKSNQPKVITLSDGRVVKVYKGKGKHAMKAMEESEGKSREYLPCLMKQLVTIDEQAIVPEDMEEMDLSDYTEIQAAFAEVNFTLTPKK